MPDGDIVHSRLRRLYQEPYKWLCEGVATSDDCARALLEALKKDLKDKGDLSITLSQQMAASIAQIISNLEEARESDFAKLSVEFDNLVQQSDGSRYVKDLMLSAGKSYLNDLRYGREVDITHTSESIWRRYAHEVYESEFKERIPLTSEHHAGVAQEILDKRIEAMKPSIDSGIRKFTQTAIRNQSVARLSMPRSSSRKAIDLDEDLLAG
ncbi:MAG: hypothetical protein HC910_08380 [Spirulinaceae cyanobacterium SM2_1_0]|nr:hypothetical protein [Spirulinaceae cyanobacterium SM2_1_0]NJO52040.1 hypothetical protein [Leptolyngbyaceae cyanobacterium RM2_2_4]